MDIPATLIAAFPPSPEALLERIRLRADDAMLRAIAEADYGEQADAMFAMLRPIRDRGNIPAPMDPQLSEVLNLTRNSDPQTPNAPPFDPKTTDLRGHGTRLFACAVLMRAWWEPGNAGCDTGHEHTFLQSLISAGVLGEETSEALACFLTWLLPQISPSTDRWLPPLGLLILALRLRPGRLAESDLGVVADWVLAHESEERRQFPPDPDNPRPTLFTWLPQPWQTLAAELTREAKSIRDPDIRAQIQLCALLLDTGAVW